MNTIDRTVELKLPNNPGHVLHYTVKSIIECEKELTNRNLILTVASLAASPLSISDAYTLLKWGLQSAAQASGSAAPRQAPSFQ